MRKRGRKCNQTLKLPATALKSTQSTVCASEQMAGLVAVKTMGRVSTHGLSQTHTHTRSNTHTESHSFGAFHTYGKQEVHYTDGAAVGEGDTGNSILLFHSSHSTDVSQLQVQHLDCWADDL